MLNRLALLFVFVAALIPAAYCADRAPEQAPTTAASIAIKAPATIKVGQLAMIDVSGSNAASFHWQVVPPTDNFHVIDGGKRAVFTTSIDETADSFMLIIGGAKADTVDVKTWSIQIVGRPTTTATSIAAKVAGWCRPINSPTKRDDLAKLAQSFASVAEAARSADMTPDAMVQATTRANLKALGETNLKNWTPFFASLQAELKSLDTAGKLPDAAAHVAVWEQIADALNAI